MGIKKDLSPVHAKELISTLKTRFEENMNRHKGIAWKQVEARLTGSVLWSLSEMEATCGEPDVVILDKTNDYFFVDCASETPSARKSLCYDNEALNSRKEHKPKDSAMNLAEKMGIEILTESQYRTLQHLGKFDTKTSSWLKTPAEIRKLGGAIFGDYRYGTVFVYHNGAESYYGSRGFRGCIKVLSNSVK